MNEPDGPAHLGELDLHLFNEGTHTRLHRHLGAHPSERGTHFTVWAPNAERVFVIGDFCDWQQTDAACMRAVGGSGLWTATLPDVGVGMRYKYRIHSKMNGYVVDKADPMAFAAELPPGTASVVHRDDFRWTDEAWMEARRRKNPMHEPMSIYEVHLGSWRRIAEDGYRSASYSELAEQLVGYVSEMGFTHVELMPVMLHPYYPSWGYQTTGYYAPDPRFGTPEQLKLLIDRCHRAGMGVILDWVPSHFATDEHGLVYFDGTHCYEHADPRQGYHPDWGSAIFNYGRNEVRSFLLSSADYWFDVFHVDGLRVDAVASMLYLDYSRADGQWIPNRYGGRENLEAMEFLRDLNRLVHARFPGAVTVAEESTAWPMVSRPTELGGLGFTMKWDMGWMHDTLDYMSRDPIHRKYHHDRLTFRGMYAFTENFVLPLSHDEVVHGKGSLLAKMGGPWERRMDNLRLLFAWMYGQPGKQLLFMGSEVGSDREWSQDASVEWELLHDPRHAGLQQCLRDLNRLHREVPALHQNDFEPRGFEWIDASDAEQSVLSFLRTDGSDVVACVYNFTSVVRVGYRVGVPLGGVWTEIFNGDAAEYGGGGVGNFGAVSAEPVPTHGRPYSLSLSLPPLAGLWLRHSVA